MLDDRLDLRFYVLHDLSCRDLAVPSRQPLVHRAVLDGTTEYLHALELPPWLLLDIIPSPGITPISLITAFSKEKVTDLLRLAMDLLVKPVESRSMS